MFEIVFGYILHALMGGFVVFINNIHIIYSCMISLPTVGLACRHWIYTIL